MSRTRGFLALFAVTGLIGLMNAARQFVEDNSAIDRPLGLISLAVGVGSVIAMWGTWRRAPWAFGAVLLWAIVIVGATVTGSVLMQPFMPGLWNLVPGPLVVTAIAAITVFKAHRQLRATTA